MTPLYDVMSAQPARDAGQIQKNRMRLAVAVGDNRHYIVDEIVPRQFIQTAAKSGMPAAVVEEICTELSQRVESAIRETLGALPKDFPKDLAVSITGGLRARLEMAGRAMA